MGTGDSMVVVSKCGLKPRIAKRLRVKFMEVAVSSDPCGQDATQVSLHLDSSLVKLVPADCTKQWLSCDISVCACNAL